MSSSESESDNEPKKKRTCNPAHYKRNIIRNSKVKGVEYTNWRGKKIAARATGQNCKCKNVCLSMFQKDDLEFCINTMNTFANKDEQDIYLQRHIEKFDVKQRRMRGKESIPRQCSLKYFVTRRATKIKVCKKAFVAIYGITEGRVRRLYDLLISGECPHDRRGKHPKANTKSPEICSKIHQHILSFPRKKTHYSGKDIEYLDARLNIKIMHNMFQNVYPQLDVNYKFYLQYFKENFSLRFGRTQVDTCITCEQFSVQIKITNLSDNVKRTHAAELMVHKRRAKKFYNKISFVQDLCKQQDDTAAWCRPWSFDR